MRVGKLAVLVVAMAAALAAQPKLSRDPDIKNAAYGPHERNVLDVWRAKSERPAPLVVYIHGGGFRAGDKNSLSPLLLDLCMEKGISVASINYRYSQQAPYPAPMHDGARAIQFLRWKAKDWNLDPKRIAATGGSAGAGISLWLGFHNDMADAKSDDPVKRQSTRLSSMAVLAAQTSYDPRVIAKVVGEAASRHPALAQLYGLREDEMASDRAHRMFEDGSPITYLTKDDPAVFLYYTEPDEPMPADAKPGDGIHHPRFGFFLKERMDKLGIECAVRQRAEYTGQPMPQVTREMVAFFEKHFGR